jgi:hypothetical protein
LGCGGSDHIKVTIPDFGENPECLKYVAALVITLPFLMPVNAGKLKELLVAVIISAVAAENIRSKPVIPIRIFLFIIIPP